MTENRAIRALNAPAAANAVPELAPEVVKWPLLPADASTTASSDDAQAVFAEPASCAPQSSLAAPVLSSAFR